MLQAPGQFLELRRRYIQGRFGALNDEQRQAVFTTKGPLLILAGAGSGKTTVLVNRIANLILFGDAFNSPLAARMPGEGDMAELQACVAGGESPSPRLAPLLAVEAVRPWNILAITFTNKAAGELKNRLAALLGPAVGGDVNASTFHSACVRILRREAHRLGFPQSFTIYDADDQQRVLKEVYKSLSFDDRFLPVKSAASAIGRLKDRMISPSAAAANPADTRAQMVARVYAAYAGRCESAGAMDFDDLVYFAVRLLQEHAEVRAACRERFRYILVDEYQDTSVAQFMLVNLLCGEGNNVCVVGDDDQSIYRFRGATIENILGFEQRFAGTAVIRLERNYRSTGNILSAANSVISNNTSRKGKTLWTAEGDGERVSHFRAQSEQDEAAHIAEDIGRHLRQGALLRDHAVLYRMNAQSSPVENYFARGGIPYKIVGGVRFNERKEIRDLHAYMSIVANPRDEVRLRRIINEPARKIGPAAVDAVAGIAEGLGVGMLEVIEGASAYPALARAAGPLAGFWRVYAALREAAGALPIEEFAARLPELTGYGDMLRAQGEEGETRLENIGQLVSNVKTYADLHAQDASIEGYLEEVALISDIDNYDEQADRVVMMTLHAAKGLEFPYVYMVGMEEGIFPGEQSRWNREDLEEERRLCYVGITRAKRGLTLLSAESRMLYGQTRRNRPSRFVGEIAPERIEETESPMLAADRHGAFKPQYAEGLSRGGGGYLDGEYNRGAPQQRAAFAPREPRRATPRPLSVGTVGGQAPAARKPEEARGEAYAAGDAVEHKTFGRGVVRKVTPVAGDSIVEIAFDSVGVKKTMANFAPLKKL